MEESKYSYEGWTPEHKPNVIMAIELINKDINQLGTPYFFGDNGGLIEYNNNISSNSTTFTLSFNGKIPVFNNNDNFILLVKTDTTGKKLYRLVQSIKYDNKDTIDIIPIENYEHEWINEDEIIADLKALNKPVIPDNLDPQTWNDKISELENLFPSTNINMKKLMKNADKNSKKNPFFLERQNTKIIEDAKKEENQFAEEEAEAEKQQKEQQKAEAEAKQQQKLAEDKRQQEQQKLAEAEAKQQQQKLAEAEKQQQQQKAEQQTAEQQTAEQQTAEQQKAETKLKLSQMITNAIPQNVPTVAKQTQVKSKNNKSSGDSTLDECMKDAKGNKRKEYMCNNQDIARKQREEEAKGKAKIEADKNAHAKLGQQHIQNQEKAKIQAKKATTAAQRKLHNDTILQNYEEKKFEKERKTPAEQKANSNIHIGHKPLPSKRGGGTINELTIQNTTEPLNMYIRKVLMNSFYFKLSALTPESINSIKDNNIKVNENQDSLNNLIIKPFVKCAYVIFNFNMIDQDNDFETILSTIIPHEEGDSTIHDIKTSIEKDTNNYLQIMGDDSIKNKEKEKAIHIFNYIDIIEKSFINKDYDLKDNFEKYATSINYDKIQLIIDLYNLSKNNYDITVGKETKPLQVYIDGLIDSQNRTNIMTFLKINNTEPGLNSKDRQTKWNQRYQIQLNQVGTMKANYKKSSSMLLGYNDNDNFPYYQKNNDKVTVLDDISTKTNNNITLKTISTGNNEIDKVQKYKNHYLFGNFQEIFPIYNLYSDQKELITNKFIADNKMTAITEQICEKKKPVFLLGYGTSGSGKTSSLIYFNNASNNDDKDGIIVHLCKKIIENKINGNDISSVKVTIQEYTSQGEETERNYMFNDNLKYFKGDTYENHHEYHTKITGNSNFKITGETTLGELLKQLVDVDRLVKATPNNPQSSRSHVLVFISFHNAMNNILGNLIVGDFAGKENEFQCNNIDVITDFLNKKITNSESTYQGKPFYSFSIRVK